MPALAERFSGLDAAPVKADSPGIYAWLLVALLWVVALLNYLDRLMVTSMRDWIIHDIPMSDARFGLLTSGFLWIYGLVSPVGGFLADRFGRKWVIMVSLTVWSAMMLVTGEMHTFRSLLVARSIMGVSEACYLGAALALITDYHTGATRSFATGLHQSGLYVGAALGGAGGWLAASHGWRVAFGLLGVLGIVYAVFLGFVLRDRRAGPRSAVAGKGEAVSLRELGEKVLPSRSFWILALYVGLAGTAFWLVNGWQPTLMKDRFLGWDARHSLQRFLPDSWIGHLAVTAGSAGLWATVPVQVASFIGILIGGKWADRWSLTNHRGRLLIIVIGFMFGSPCLLLLAWTPSFGFAIGGMVIFGLSRGFADANLMPVVCQVLDPRYRASVYGFLNLAGVTVGGLMIYAGGWLRDQNVSLSVSYSIAAVGLFAAGLSLLFIRTRPGAD